MTSSATSPTSYTARQLARTLGVSDRVLRRRLASVRESCLLMDRGGECRAWTFDALPFDLQQRLEELRAAGGYGSIDELVGVAAVGGPALPAVGDCHPEDVAGAVKLRAALERALVANGKRFLAGSELVAMGLEDYRRTFGHAISERHWRRLLQRTITRAGASQDFTRLELFLPDQPRLKPDALPAANVEGEDEWLAAIRSRIRNLGTLSKFSRSQRELIWRLALGWFHERVEAGEPGRAVKEILFSFLQSAAPALARSRDSLRIQFNTRLRDPAALEDRRILANAKRSKLYLEDEIDRLVFEACEKFRGRVAPAVRALLGDEPERVLLPTSINFKSHSKSYVPETLLDEVSRRVEEVAPFFQGPRAADAATPALDLSYDGIHSMDCVVLDDFTFNSYVYLELPGGKFKLSRCQVILAIDFRSLSILGWSLAPEEQPNSLAARTVCARVFRDHGIPKLLYLEQGKIFKDSILMTGGVKARRHTLPGWDDVSDTEAEVGLRQFGLGIIHAGRARSKPIERVGDLVQSLMDGEPGWAGRNERFERPEALTRQMYEVETGKTHPSKYFFSYDEWNLRLRDIFSRYNATAQEGKRLMGETPDQMFDRLWPHEDPPIKFDSRCEFLLAHHRSTKEIKGGAISFKVRKESYHYRDDRLSPDEGKLVLAHWNPELPEFITITDKHLRNPIVIARGGKPNALSRLNGKVDPVLDEETAKVNRHMRYWRTYYNTLKAKFKTSFRVNVVAPRVEQLGQTIQDETSRLQSEQREQQSAERTRRQIAVKLGRRPEELPPAAADYNRELQEGLRELRRETEGG